MGFLQSGFAIEPSIQPPTRRNVIFVNERRFELGCVVNYMEGELPELQVVGLSSLDQIGEFPAPSIALVIVDLPTHPAAANAAIARISQLAEAVPDTAIAVSTSAEADCEKVLNELKNVRGVFPATLAPPVVAAILKVLVAGGHYFHRPIHSLADERPQPSLRIVANNDDMGGAATRPTSNAPIGETEIKSAPTFTAREAQILAKLAEGLQNKLIAANLGMPENTVKVHIRNIMRKLKATNRTAAVVAAQRMNVLAAIKPGIARAN
jgi:DNA-binding NarL/FixJ family response regulator